MCSRDVQVIVAIFTLQSLSRWYALGPVTMRRVQAAAMLLNGLLKIDFLIELILLRRWCKPVSLALQAGSWHRLAKNTQSSMLETFLYCLR